MNRAATTHRAPSSLWRGAGRDFDSLFADLWSTPFLRPSVSAGNDATSFVPRLDALETESEYRLTAELPGLEDKDFTIEIEDGVLTLSGEKRSRWSEGEEGGTVRRVETSYGRFERRVRFDGAIDEDGVQATFKNGVLEIVVPKPAEARPQVRTIEVTSA